MSATDEERLTFLFSDVEGSTRLWEAYPVEMPAALARHLELLADAVEAHGGRVLDTAGDGMTAAFDDPSAAVAAAHTALRSLTAETWAVTGPLRARIGVHTGYATPAGDKYVGGALNRCARLMSIGHGGQVLLSSTTAELVQASRLPATTRLDDMGMHRLRDLPGREHVFQLVDPELPHAFPPLRSSDAYPGNLPKRLTSFLGRETELAALRDALISARLITLVGFGGLGKTSLALQLAADRAAEFDHGAWVLELASLHDSDAIVDALATVLSVPPAQGSSTTDSLVEALRHRHMLLVFDNCEHLLGAASRLVETLLEECPRLTILATSREALGIAGEQVWPVRPLAAPDPGSRIDLEHALEWPAVRLFVERAQAVRPDVALTSSTVGAVVEICSELEGLPLALELAAARIGSLTAADIARRLQERFSLLSRGRRTADQRHRSLRAMVAWSYDLLCNAERLLFDRLSVFSGGCTLDAAESVCAGDGIATAEVVDLLTSLADKSLIVAEDIGGLTRYSMLETLRAFGQEHLDARDGVSAVRRRHTAYFAQFAADQWRSARTDRAGYVHRIKQEFANLRAAQHAALSIGDAPSALALATSLQAYASSGLSLEPFTWAAAAARLPQAADHPLRPEALAGAAWGEWRKGDLVSAVRNIEEAIALEERLPIPWSWRVTHALAFMRMYQGEMAAACELFERAEVMARDSRDLEALARVLQGHTFALIGLDELDRAAQVAEEAVRMVTGLGDELLVAWCQYALGEALAETDPERALAMLDASTDYATSVENEWVAGLACLTATTIRGRVASDPTMALAGYLELIQRWRDAGHWTQQWLTLRNLVELLARLGRLEAAAVLHGAVEAAGQGAPKGTAEARRLGTALALVRAGLGANVSIDVEARGRAMARDDVVAFARAEVASLLDAAS
jgi:predicted ATPase/class 3 adenylate cyclase